MTRGNQRELAREKNMKKQQDGGKKKGTKGGEGLTLEQRKYRDAEKMREKQKQNEQKKEEKTK